MNFDTMQLPKLSFFTKVKMAIAAGVILCVGIMTSIFLLTISAIMLPFVAIGMWFVQQKVQEQQTEAFAKEEMASAQ